MSSSLLKLDKSIPSASLAAIEAALVRGDLSQLSVEDRVYYYNSLCVSLGLNPLTRPFEYLSLDGRLTLYARRDAADQLRQIHKISVDSLVTTREGDLIRSRAEVSASDGRKDAGEGLVWIGHLKNPQNAKDGTLLANMYMKVETKAKRRATLSICGLGMLDETEVEDIRKERAAPANGSGTSKAAALNSRGAAPKPEPEPEPVEEAEVIGPADFICQLGGSFQGKKLSEIPIDDITKIINWINSQASITPKQTEFVTWANRYLGETKGEKGNA